MFQSVPHSHSLYENFIGGRSRLRATKHFVWRQKFWVLSRKLASCQLSAVYNFEVTPRLLENLNRFAL